MTEKRIAICEDCRQAIANDDYTALDYHSRPSEAERRMLEIAAGVNRLLDAHTACAVRDSLGFIQTPCNCCGDVAHGERFQAVLL